MRAPVLFVECSDHRSCVHAVHISASPPPLRAEQDLVADLVDALDGLSIRVFDRPVVTPGTRHDGQASPQPIVMSIEADAASSSVSRRERVRRRSSGSRVGTAEDVRTKALEPLQITLNGRVTLGATLGRTFDGPLRTVVDT
jgi:hypothetical protein